MSKLPRRPVDLEATLLPSSDRPKAFESTQQLYVMHFFFAFVARMWDMGIILLVAQLTNNSLFLVAITGMCGSMSVFLFMGSIGGFLDRTNRITAVRLALFFKVLAVSAAYFVCAYLNMTSVDAEGVVNITSTRQLCLLYSIPVLSAFAVLSFSAIIQSVEKDWIVVLSAKDTVWLSNTNSVMTQIDLACSSLAPMLTGLLFAHCSHSIAALVLLLVNAISTIALYFYMIHLYHAWPALGQKIGVDVLEAADLLARSDQESLASDLSDEDAPLTQPPNYGATHNNSNGAGGKSRMSARSAAELNFQASRRMSADAVRLNKQNDPARNSGPAVADDTPCCAALFATCSNACSCLSSSNSGGGVFDDFMQSGCAGMMVSYAALYLTVLSFGSVMTVYVRWAGVSDDLLGLFRGLGALFGYSGAVLFPTMSSWMGLWEAGQLAIVYQFILVAIAASSFAWASSNVTVYVIIFAVLLSRTGLWLFDLCVRQIAQETIHESVRGKVNGQWRSLVAFFEMAGYVAAVLMPDPQHFWMLTSLSASMIGFALITYTLTNPTNQRCCAVCGGHTGGVDVEGGATHSAVIGVGEGYRAVPTADGVILSGAAASAAAVTNHRSSRRAGDSLGGLEMKTGTNTGNSK